MNERFTGIRSCKVCLGPESPTCIDLCVEHEREMDERVKLRNFINAIKMELYIKGFRTCAVGACSMEVSWLGKLCDFHGGKPTDVSPREKFLQRIAAIR